MAAVTGLVVGDTIISGQNNRVPEPTESTFCVMTPIRFTRLETNLDTYADVKFTGSITDTAMTVSTVVFGTLLPGATVFGPNVAANTVIVSQSIGPPGGAGIYLVSTAQTVAAGTLSCGGQTLTQGAEIVIQLDFHSADLTAGDLAQTTSTMLRDEYGVDFFAALSPPLNGVVPLYADDPRQMPFINAESQYEWRWVLEAKLQVNQAVQIPQQFADSAVVDAISVEAEFPL